MVEVTDSSADGVETVEVEQHDADRERDQQTINRPLKPRQQQRSIVSTGRRKRGNIACKAFGVQKDRLG